jgi:hypothetical protein
MKMIGANCFGAPESSAYGNGHITYVKLLSNW